MEAWLTRSARRHGERLALVTSGESLTYAQLHARALEVAGALQARGIGRGDRVALALPSETLVVAVHGCLLIGAVAVPIDLRLGTAERQQRTQGVALVLSDLITGSPPDPAELPEIEMARTATLMFTSGTTAGPKPVALSYENWMSNAIGSALALGLDPQERWLCPMPLAHVGGLSIQIRSAIYGTTVLLHGRFDTERALAALMDPGERVTLVSLVPTMLGRLLDVGLRQPPTLRRVLLGGGPIAPSLLRRAAQAGVAVAPSYGMTETCSQAVTDGFPLLGVEVRIAVGGEVRVRGANVATGMLSPDGWLHTGDLGRIDADGRLTIEGRKDDTIITGGENVAPVEVEQVLLEHPAVVDAGVFARPDPEWGEAVVAQVVAAEGGEIDSRDLREFCAAQLAPFKVPKLIEIVDELPRGVTGKLLRRQLA